MRTYTKDNHTTRTRDQVFDPDEIMARLASVELSLATLTALFRESMGVANASTTNDAAMVLAEINRKNRSIDPSRWNR